MKSFFTDFRNVCHRRILLATNLLILFLLIGSQHMAAQDTSHIEPLLSDTNHVAIRDTTSPVIITQDTNKATTQNIIRNIPVHSVKGKITDEKGLPLFGVSVQIKGTDKGVVTSADGNYFIQVSDSAVLVFSYVGYVTEEIPVLGKSTVDISMASKKEELTQVVVVGYGTQRKVDITGATETVRGTELVKQPVMTATHALQGKAAGVQIISSGQPGVAPQVRIRGVGSILGGVNPLYVVDGIITDDITNINTADILTVDILKDASSSAIYGARAANGVILITTRQGSGKMKVNYNVNVGIRQAANLVKMANAQQYLTYETEALGPSLPASNYNTDWYNQILRNAFYQDHNVSVSGGEGKNKYLLNLSYLGDEGIIINNTYDRYTVRFNNEFDVSSQIKIGIVSSFSNETAQNVPIQTAFTDAYRVSPMVPGFIDGRYGNSSKFQNVGNPILDTKSTNDKSINNKLQGDAYLEYKPVQWITLRSAFGDEVNFYNDRSYTYMLLNDTTVFDVNGGSQGASQSNLSLTTTTEYHWTWDNTITFNKTFNKHRITALFGTTAEKYSQTGFTASRPNVPPDPNLWYLQDGNQNLQYNDSKNQGIATYTRNSYLSRISYAYNDKYLFTGTIRADGSSVFSSANRWGYFPSVGVGWVLTKENFMQSQNAFSYLKLKASWGKVGNSNIPTDASSITLLQNQPYFFGGATNSTSGSIVPQIKDVNIKWETTDESDIGVEFTVLKNKLTGEIDVYDKNTSNALIYVRVPGTYGSQANPNSSIAAGYVLTNAASIENKGLEITLRWNNKINDNLSYNIGGNISFNKNNVTGLNGGQPYYEGVGNQQIVTITTTGHPIGSFYVAKVLGVFNSQNEINNYKSTSGQMLQPTAEPGDFKYQYNPNGTLDTVFAGSYQPVAYFGLSVGVNYKAFDFSIDLYGNVGNQVYNGKKAFRQSTTDNVEASVAENSWTNSNHTQTNPRPNGGNLPASTYFIESGDFVRINNLTIGYTIPAKKLQNQKVISGFRIYTNCQNLFTLKKYSGFTAELPGTDATNQGIEFNSYPTTRTYALGINVDF